MAYDKYQELVDEQFIEISKMLTEMQSELSKYSPMEQLEYIKPLRYLVCEALTDLYHKKHERINSADLLLNNIKKDE